MSSGSDDHNGNGGSAFHPWEHMRAGEDDDAPEMMEEVHLDCQGHKRTFRLTNYGRGVASALEALEIRDGETSGLRLRVLYNEETHTPPYYELRQKLAERLASRDLVRDPDTRRLDVLNMLLRAQVGPRPEGSAGSELFVDDLVLSWEDVGELLQTYEGWGLRIQVTEE